MTDFQSHTFILNQASEVSRNRGASLLARPGHSLIAAIRSQHQHESLPLGMYPKSLRLQQPNCWPCPAFLIVLHFLSLIFFLLNQILTVYIQLSWHLLCRLGYPKTNKIRLTVQRTSMPGLLSFMTLPSFLLSPSSSHSVHFLDPHTLLLCFIQQSIKSRNTGFK